MILHDALLAKVSKILKDPWKTREGKVVPAPAFVGHGNDAVKIHAAVLHANVVGATELVDGNVAWFAAEMYKSFLHCVAKIVMNEGGEISSAQGDRVMAVFIGDAKEIAAVRAALQINYAVQNIINPSIADLRKSSYLLKHVVGIDSGDLFVIRNGIPDPNGLTWIGPAANYAAKLAGLSSAYQTYVTEAVFNELPDFIKFSGSGSSIWEEANWEGLQANLIFKSSWAQTIR